MIFRVVSLCFRAKRNATPDAVKTLMGRRLGISELREPLQVWFKSEAIVEGLPILSVLYSAWRGTAEADQRALSESYRFLPER